MAGFRVHALDRPVGIGDTEEIEEQRQLVGEAGAKHTHPALDLFSRDRIGVGLGDSEERAQQRQHREQRDVPGMGLGGDVKHGDASLAAPFRELMAEAAFADTGLADDSGQLATSPRKAGVERALQRAQLLFAADQAGQAAFAGDVEGPEGFADRLELEDLDIAGALDLAPHRLSELEVALSERRARRAEADLAGPGELLHPLREPDRMTDRGIGHVAALADRADDDLTRIHADPHGEIEAGRFAQLIAEPGQLTSHLQGREACPARVVLVRERGAEDRHDAVAGELVDGTLEGVHADREKLEAAVHYRAPLLGIDPLGELHRVGDIGEQDRYLLALTLDRRALGADTGRKVRGGRRPLLGFDRDEGAARMAEAGIRFEG